MYIFYLFVIICQIIKCALHNNVFVSSKNEFQHKNDVNNGPDFFEDLKQFLVNEINPSSNHYYDNTFAPTTQNFIAINLPICSSFRNDIHDLPPSNKYNVNKTQNIPCSITSCQSVPIMSYNTEPQPSSQHSGYSYTYQFTKTCETSGKIHNRASMEFIKPVARSVLYYRHCICYVFKHYYKRNSHYVTKYEINDRKKQLYDFITTTCLDLCKNYHIMNFTYTPFSNVEIINDIEYEQLKQSEQILITLSKTVNGEQKCEKYDAEIKKIRSYNRQCILQITQNISDTILSSFYANLKPYFSDNVKLEIFTDMFVYFLMSLYELSLFFYQNVDQKAQHAFKEIWTNSEFCMNNYCNDKYFLFYWVFSWVHFFSCAETTKCKAEEKRHSSQCFIFLNEFSSQFVILIHLLYNSHDNQIPIDKITIFFNYWKFNIINLLFSKKNTEFFLIYTLLYDFFNEISDIYQPKILLKSTVKYLRILPTSQENINNSFLLDPKIKKHLKILYCVSKKAFLNAKSELHNKCMS